jgi:hypothetical protein
MDLLNDTLSVLIRNLLSLSFGPHTLQKGGNDVNLDELINEFHEKRDDEQRFIEDEVDVDVLNFKYVSQKLGTQVLQLYYAKNIHILYEIFMKKTQRPTEFDYHFNKYVKSCFIIDKLEYVRIGYDTIYSNLNDYEIAHYIVMPLIHYFKDEIELISLIEYIKNLLQMKHSDFLMFESMLNESPDKHLTAVMYKTLISFVHQNKEYLNVACEKFEDMIIYLIENEANNMCIISPYLLSYHNNHQNRIFDYINDNCDVMYPVFQKSDRSIPNTILLYKSFNTLNNTYTISKKVDGFRRNGIKSYSVRYIEQGLDTTNIVQQFIDDYIDRTDVCLIPFINSPFVNSMNSFRKFVKNIHHIIHMYKMYDTYIDFRELCDVLCDKNHTIDIIYGIQNSNGNNKNALDGLIYHIFKNLGFCSYRNHRLIGLYDWYDFDKRINNNVLLEEYMIESFNNPKNIIDISSNREVIYSMSYLLSKNTDNLTIVNTYLNLYLMNEDISAYGLVHILNRISHLYTGQTDVIHDTLKIQYTDVLINDDFDVNVNLVHYYLVKYDVINYDNINQLVDILYFALRNLTLTYEYHNTQPHTQKYKVEDTIEKNYGIKTVQCLINKAYQKFSSKEVTECFVEKDLLHYIASINCFGDNNTELIDIAIEIMNVLFDNEYDVNEKCWKHSPKYNGFTAIYFATNNRIIEYLMKCRINFGTDIFPIMFSSVSDFHFYECMFESIYGFPYKVVIDKQFNENKDKLVEYFIDLTDNSYLNFNQSNLEKYERYGILQNISDKGRKLSYLTYEDKTYYIYIMKSSYSIQTTSTQKILKLINVSDKGEFNEFINSDDYVTRIGEFSNYANTRITLQRYSDMYSQFSLFDNSLRSMISHISILDMNIQLYPIIDFKLLEKYEFNVEEQCKLLSELSNAISFDRAKEYVEINNTQLSSDIHVDPKYQKYLSMFGITPSYNQQSIKYLDTYKRTNPEYYSIIDFWMFGEYQKFNETLQAYRKPLIKETLTYFTDIKEYDSYYKSIVLSEIIHDAPRTQNKLITYRGVKNEKSMPDYKYDIGDEIVFTRFTSVTLNHSVAESFSKHNKDLIMTIIIPPNSTCINLVTSENEILLPRYSIFKYIGNNTMIYIGYNIIPTNQFTEKSTDTDAFVPFDEDYRKITNEYMKDHRRISHVVFDKNGMKSDIFELMSMDEASSENRVDILDKWKKSGKRLDYTVNAMNDASEKGNIEVLKWWKKSGLKLKYTDETMDYASENGKIGVLDWWKNSNLELKYTDYAMDIASEHGDIEVLKWWKNSGLKLLYPKNILDSITGDEYEHIRKWWNESGLLDIETDHDPETETITVFDDKY